MSEKRNRGMGALPTPAHEILYPPRGVAQKLKVYIVTDGMGGEIDSVWRSDYMALRRIDELNHHPGFGMEWILIEKEVQ